MKISYIKYNLKNNLFKCDRCDKLLNDLEKYLLLDESRLQLLIEFGDIRLQEQFIQNWSEIGQQVVFFNWTPDLLCFNCFTKSGGIHSMGQLSAYKLIKEGKLLLLTTVHPVKTGESVTFEDLEVKENTNKCEEVCLFKKLKMNDQGVDLKINRLQNDTMMIFRDGDYLTLKIKVTIKDLSTTSLIRIIPLLPFEKGYYPTKTYIDKNIKISIEDFLILDDDSFEYVDKSECLYNLGVGCFLCTAGLSCIPFCRREHLRSTYKIRAIRNNNIREVILKDDNLITKDGSSMQFGIKEEHNNQVRSLTVKYDVKSFWLILSNIFLFNDFFTFSDFPIITYISR